MDAPKVEGSVTLSAEDAASTIRQLHTRVRQLEREVAFEREQSNARAIRFVSDTIRYLRFFGVILLNTGIVRPGDITAQDRIEEAGVAAALEEAWNLSKAPLPPEVIEQVRTACQGGHNRW